MSCQDERWAELVVGRALDALEPGDEAALEMHVVGCPDCIALLADMRHVAASMAYAVEDAEPPADLFPRIRAALPPRPNMVSDTPPVIDLEQARQRRRLRPGRRVVAGVAAISVAAAFGVIGAYSVRVHSDRDQARSSLAAESSVIRELQDGTAYRVALTSGGQAGGFAVVDGRSVSLVTSDLNDNDSRNSIYVLWAAAAPGMAMTAVTGFDVHKDGVNVVQALLPASVLHPQIFGVTEEKGRTIPTTPGRAVLGVSSAADNT